MPENFQYTISKTGRVKAAGVPFDMFFNINGFKQNPTINQATAIRKHFHGLRQNPPEEVRNRFLPRNRGNKDMFRNGPQLTRPSLKTDQGAGRFAAFDSGEGNNQSLRYTIKQEFGFVIPERFFYQQLEDCGFPSAIMDQLHMLNATFQSGDVPATQLQYEQLQLLCEPLGISTTTNARVGREAVFFIRPNETEKQVIVSREVHHQVQDTINSISDSFSVLAHDAKLRFAQQHDLTAHTDRFFHPAYFQADVQLFPDGTTRLDQIQLPDVGLFLSELTPNGNQALKGIQDKVDPIKNDVIKTLIKTINTSKTSHVYLITRPEVIDQAEDTLELLEIQVLQQELAKHEVFAQAITLDQALELSTGDIGLLLNVDPKTESFQRLLEKRLTDDHVPIYPDPFLLSAVKEMTQYQQRSIGQTEIANLRAIVAELEPDSSPNKQFTQLMALDNYLTKLGLTEDVFHIYLPSQAVPIACYRLDIRGIQIAINTIGDNNQVNIRSVPISPERSLLFDNQDRPFYCVFRYMATLKD